MDMRFMAILFALLGLLLLPSCRDLGIGPTGPYDYMFVERVGAGDLGFNVFPKSSADSFQVEVTHREFHDTTIAMILVKNDTNSTSFEALIRALQGDEQISGDFRQSTLPTGTWVTVFMIKGPNRFEVTDVGLRNLLLPFEQMVRGKLGQPHALAP
jgi:hypothetical protein